MAFSVQLGSLTDELIEAIIPTTAQIDHSRFSVLRERSLQNLRHHSFLRTNQFEVSSALDGWEERFRVLNRDRLADALRDRLDALALCSNKWTPDVLDLLLKLADQPAQKSSLDDLSRLKLKVPDKEPEETLKWSDIAKEDRWDKDGELWRNVDFGGYSSGDDYVNYETDASARSDDTSSSDIEARYRKRPADYAQSLHSPSGLEEIRKSQAWRRRRSVVDGTTQSQKISITELQAIREILFMLSGLENGLFDRQGNPETDIQLTHATWQTFRSLLTSSNDARWGLSALRQYVKQQQKIPLLQSFQAAIQSRLELFDGIIATMQTRYASTNQDLVISIMKLLDDLKPHLHPLESLAQIVERLERSENAQPFHFLELLFDSAEALQLECDEGAYRFIGQLFFDCFAAYLQPIRLWMQNGELIDDDKSFFVSRSPLDIPRSQVWADQFRLKKTSQGSLFAPRFLQPAASKILVAGKSIVILKLLGQQWPTHEQPEHATEVDMNTVSEHVPFAELFRNMFEQWMQDKHHAASTTLKQSLFQTYNFWSDLGILHRIYLMTDGSRSEQFANAVFNNIDIFNLNWHDRFNLTEMAREAFDGLIEPHRLTVNTSPDSLSSDVESVQRSVRVGLPSIRITYRLPWLSRIVLTDASLGHYQLVFTFLLQLRRAGNVLTKHRLLSDGLAYTAEQEIFYGLRSKLLWFCNTLQSYISTLVLEPLVEKFREQITQADDIDQMLTSHSVFTKQMVDEACLGSKLDPIRQGILDIFDLAIGLRNSRQIELDMEAEKSLPSQLSETPYSQVLGEIRTALDRHLKFICGGLRGVARASSSEAASKWDILAEMLEVGTRGP